MWHIKNLETSPRFWISVLPDSVNSGRSGVFRGRPIFVKKNGHWQILQAQGTRLAPERNPINLDPKLLESFLGEYEFGPNAIATVTREGDTLRWRGGNRMPVMLVPLSETLFFAKESETEIMFVKNEKGQVTGAILRLGSCQESKAQKIE